MTLEQIEQLIKQGRYEEATEAGQNPVAENPALEFEVIRLRSYMFSRKADYKAAVRERLSIIQAGEATIRDYDSGAFWALYDGQIEQALEWYLVALQIGEKQNDTWFRSNELCLVAYIYMELGEFEKAISFLDKSESNGEDGSFLVPNKGFCERKQLRDEITLRSRGK